MALPRPNTNPDKGRPSRSAPESTAMAEGLNDVENIMTEQLQKIMEFTEVMRNYIPKLGFIDAHTQKTKLSTDQIKKDLKEVAKQLTETPIQENDGEEVDQDTEGEDGGEPVATDEEKTIADRIKNIDDNVQKMADRLDEPSEEEEDARNLGGADGGDQPPPTGPDEAGLSEGDKKNPIVSAGGKMIEQFMKFFKMIGKFIAVGLLLLLPLLSGNERLFAGIKEMVDNLFRLFSSVFDLIMGAIVPLATALMTIIITIINLVMSILMPIIEAVIPIITRVVELAINIVMGVVDAIVPIIETIISIIVPIIQMVLGLILFIFDNVTRPLLEKLLPIIGIVGDIITFFFDLFIDVFNGAIEFIAGLADFVGMGDKVRSFKIEKDESDDAAETIDFAQDDEAVEAQIQAKLDSGEINQKTADSLRKDKEKHREKQQERRDANLEAMGVSRVADIPESLKDDASKVNLIKMNIPALGGDVLVDSNPKENGKYRVYDMDGNPIDYRPKGGKSNKTDSITPMIHAAIEDLESKEAQGEGDGAPVDIAAAFGMSGQDVSDESLDTQDAVGAAAAAGGAGGGSSSVNVVGGASSTTNVKNEQSVTSTSSSPTSGRGRRFRR